MGDGSAPQSISLTGGAFTLAAKTVPCHPSSMLVKATLPRLPRRGVLKGLSVRYPCAIPAKLKSQYPLPYTNYLRAAGHLLIHYSTWRKDLYISITGLRSSPSSVKISHRATSPHHTYSILQRTSAILSNKIGRCPCATVSTCTQLLSPLCEVFVPRASGLKTLPNA